MEEQIDEIEQMTNTALDQVRKIAVELRPSVLDDLGLIPAIRSYIQRYGQVYGIHVELKTDEKQRRYESNVETVLYRVCQEALTNIAKHSGTTHALVNIHHDKEYIIMSIEDYGKGFDSKQYKPNGTNLGLFGMKERAHLVNGSVEVISSPGKGTTVQIIIPYKEQNDAQSE
ncbi:sensor histidine kinase [Aneurinibacillus uraniidurans]|uniref:sensor histidine kinase n=1 Tax=Aneurinibacillus uraniidurans TaxID=2966586 RepID=UPI002349F4A8|nr:sensor histidine kinase [Aneurinibacillus sp. B1]WCN39168.1 sensor histidine kinase [Aneurinibacillus sp. B1]